MYISYQLHSYILKFKLLFFILIIPFTISGQQTIIETSNTLNLYCGLNNPVKIVHEKFQCKELLLISKDSNVSIKKEGCKYYVNPKMLGLAYFFVLNNKDSTLLDTFSIPVKKVPQPLFHFHYAGFEGAQLMLDYIIVKNEIWDRFNIPYKVLEFEIYAKRNELVLFQFINKGQSFNNEVKSNIEKLKPGDKLYIENIYMQVDSFYRSINKPFYHKIF